MKERRGFKYQKKRSERMLKRTGDIMTAMTQKKGAMRRKGVHIELKELVKQGNIYP